MSMLIPMPTTTQMLPPAPPPRYRAQRFSPAVVRAVVALQDAAERLDEAQRAATILPPSSRQ